MKAVAYVTARMVAKQTDDSRWNDPAQRSILVDAVAAKASRLAEARLASMVGSFEAIMGELGRDEILAAGSPVTQWLSSEVSFEVYVTDSMDDWPDYVPRSEKEFAVACELEKSLAEAYNGPEREEKQTAHQIGHSISAMLSICTILAFLSCSPTYQDSPKLAEALKSIEVTPEQQKAALDDLRKLPPLPFGRTPQANERKIGF